MEILTNYFSNEYKLKYETTRKWLRLAKAVKEVETPCFSRSIGVVIVDPETNSLVSSGHNGPPQGCPKNDDPDYLRNVVWPQLTDEEVKLSMKGSGDQCDDFVKAYANCATCPRKSVGAASGKRLELCTCLSYSSRVFLPNGKLTKIGKLVDAKYNGKVKSYNLLSGVVEDKKVIGWHKFDLGADKFYKIHTKYGRDGRFGKLGARFTKDHKILTVDGWKEVKDIQVGDLIYIPENKLNDLQTQVILGSCLGDGTISKPSCSGRFSVYHIKKHEGYINFKRQLLNGLRSRLDDDIRNKITPNGKVYINHEMKKLFTECSLQLSKLRDLIYHNGKKTISKEWLSKINDLGLAFWYLDDGSIISNKTGYISIHKFINDHELLIEWFDKKFNIQTRMTTGKRLYFNAVAFEKLCKIIAKYTPDCMKYKILPKYRESDLDIPISKDCGLAFDEIVEIEEVENLSSDKKYSYCIDVADNHNFLTNNCVAHNCIHGEVDAITRANRSVAGCYMMCYCGVPCIECSKVIINAGIDTVVGIDHGRGDYSLYSSRWLFEKSKVQLVLVSEDWIWEN